MMPSMIPYELREKIKIPNEEFYFLEIEPLNKDKGEFNKGTRKIRFLEFGVTIISEEEEVILSPYEYLFIDTEEIEKTDDEEIIKSFHDDDIEFI